MQNQQLDRSVVSLVAVGMTNHDIAALLEVPRKQIRREHRLDLRKGKAEGNLKVMDALHAAASSGKNIPATMFWLKARCGWRDTGPASEPNIVRRYTFSCQPEPPKPGLPEPRNKAEKDSHL